MSEYALVTGATGLVGYNIVTALRRRRRRVRALVRNLEKGRSVLPEECELVQGDVTDRASLDRAVAGCAVIYHAAGDALRDRQSGGRTWGMVGRDNRKTAPGSQGPAPFSPVAGVSAKRSRQEDVGLVADAAARGTPANHPLSPGVIPWMRELRAAAPSFHRGRPTG